MKTQAIYGIVSNGEAKLTFTDTEGWPDCQGRKILELIHGFSDELLRFLFSRLSCVEDDNADNQIDTLTGKIRLPNTLNSEYKYIINLDNSTLEYYCHNNIPRTKFSLKNIRSAPVEETVRVMNALDDNPKQMYDLFSLSA